MLTRDAARKAGVVLSGHGASVVNGSSSCNTSEDPIVLLGCGSSAITNAFISAGTGRPYLQLDAGVGTDAALAGETAELCDLRHPQQVLAAGVRVLEAGFPNDTRERLPPLIKSLCDLMDLLGSLR
jgi:hypothetical protein